ncbi:MAG: hypothetical protein R2726_09975 [Acidimicrobiales bacterium]
MSTLASDVAADEQVLVAVEGPLDLRATVGVHANGRRDPTLRRAADGVWLARRTPDGPATLHLDDRELSPRDGGPLLARAWGPGASAALTAAPGIVGLHDDPGALVTDHPVVARLRRHRPGLRTSRSAAMIATLVPAVIGQKVQAVAAHESWAHLVHALSVRAPGPARLWLPPDPDRLAATPYEVFHRFDLERRRAEVIRRVSARAERLERLVDEPTDVALASLRRLPGIGPWTAGHVGRAVLGDPDVVLVGDYNLPHRVAFTLAGERRATDERMLELLAPFAGQRGRVQRLIALGGVSPPRRGPRLPRRRIAGS